MAVMDLMKENNISVPVPAADTVGKNIPVNGGFYTHAFNLQKQF
jgi:hypothetical protein